MKKLISTILILLLSTVQSQVIAEEKDPYTVYVQEQLTSLGFLDTELTGVNDSATFKAIQEFQEKANLKIDGLAGPNTLAALLGGESSFINNNDKTAPSWSDDPITTNQRNKTFNVFWGVVNDDSGISHFNIYVNGVLADSELLENGRYRVTNFQCAEKITVTVEAVDIHGNLSFSPNKSTFTKFCELVSPIYMADTNMFLVSFDTSSTNNNYSAYLVDSKVDSQGNIYLLGRFYDSMNVLGTVISSAGGFDTFIIKLNSDGELLFAKRYGGTGDTHSRAIEVDSSGNIYFTGYLSEGSFTIDNFTAGPANNMVYTIKLNSNGERIWSMFGAANNGHNYFTDLALSNNESSLYITAGSGGSFAYGANSQTIGNTSNSGSSALFFELSTSTGSVGSVITTGGTNCNCIAEQVIIDESNNIYVAGVHAGTFDLTVDIGQSFASKGDYDIFVWKDFVPTAAISIGSESNDVIHDLKFDSNGNLLLGIKYGSSFNVSNNFSLTSENENAIIKVNSSLQFLLGYEIPNSSGSTISNIAVSQNGSIYSNYGNSSGSKIEKLDTNLNSLGKVEFVDNSQDFSSANLVGDLGIYLSNLSISPNDNLYLISSLFNRIQLKDKGKEILKSKDTTSDLFLLRLDSNLNY